MSIQPSATNVLMAKVQKKREMGERVYSFAAGDIFLPNHPAIISAVKKAADAALFPYPSVAGITPLRKSATEWINKNHKTNFTVENTVVTPGGKFAIYAALKVLLQPGDEVLIPAPYWVSYPLIVQFCGGKPVPVPAKWKVTPADLKKHLTSNTKVLILNNACNPTGVLYSKEEVAAILDFAQKSGLTVISDEVYSDLVYDKEFVSCGSRENVIITQSCSKNFGLSGWRVGFAFASEEIIQKMVNLFTQTTSGTCLIAQIAANAAFENAADVNHRIKEAMVKRRDCFFKAFGGNLQQPDSAIYAFVPIPEKNSNAFCEKVLEETGVAMVPGSAFGMEGYVRFAFSDTEEEIIAGISALKKHGYFT